MAGRSDNESRAKEGPHHDPSEYVHARALGRAIANLREERTGLSRFVFSTEADIHRNMMNHIEHGETSVGFLNLVKISNTLNVPLPELMRAYEQELAGDAAYRAS